MITKITCACGNTDVKKALHYNGCLGYEAIICKCCGRYSDYATSHEASDWSKDYLKSKGIKID
jgi:hypothetical protein